MFFLVPLVMTFWMSLHNWPLLGRARFIGLDNYTRAVGDASFLRGPAVHAALHAS